MQSRKCRDNQSNLERWNIKSRLHDKSDIIKNKRADKSNYIVVMDKNDYLAEAYRQLSSHHYMSIDTFDFKALRNSVNTYLIDMFKRNALDKRMSGNQSNLMDLGTYTYYPKSIN